ncbi:MAG TPA: hypothetical protein VK431_01340 [Nitrosopumilaceae archaeon]|nr:hypothetical protein [Nitrosopumilaceae archaeon]
MHSATKSIKLDKLCKSILDSNENIRSVEIIGKLGTTLEKLGPEKTMKLSSGSYNECLLDIALGKEFGEFYGPIRYHFSKDKSVMFSFPFDENIVFVTTTKNTSPIWLATKIAHIINKYTTAIENS